MIFQDPISSLNPRRRVADIVAESLDIWDVGDRASRREKVDDALAAVALTPETTRDRRPHEFSGGQCQRISIARAVVTEPKLIICDEPVSALDVSVQAQIINLLDRLRQDLGLTTLFIAHDLSVVRHVSDRVAVMYLGRVVELAPTRELYEAPRHPYTAALLSAATPPDPDLADRRHRVILTGEVPSPTDPPPGCPFHPRCPRARARCSVDVPTLSAGAAGTTAHPFACHFPLQPGEVLT
jgi:peptide/nickel transport system ATP-binding protein/oligopeptide transport system ATP-binding protein